MQKKYNLKIGEDLVYFTSIDVDDETNLPINENDINKFNMLSSVDKIINITDLNTVPQNGSIWNGESFSVHDEGLLDQPISNLGIKGIKTHKEYHRFAFLQNNVLLGSFYYRKDKEDHELFVAALSSNPTVVEGVQ
jgi:hypothetical protein